MMPYNTFCRVSFLLIRLKKSNQLKYILIQLGAVTISSLNNEAINVQVFNILGKLVKNETLTNNTLNVSNLKTGIYILKINQNNASTTKKLVIK